MRAIPTMFFCVEPSVSYHCKLSSCRDMSAKLKMLRVTFHSSVAHFLPLWFSIRIRTGNISGVLTGKVYLARPLIAAARGETRIHSATLRTQLVQYYCGIYQHPKHCGRAVRRFFAQLVL